MKVDLLYLVLAAVIVYGGGVASASKVLDTFTLLKDKLSGLFK